MADPSRKPKVHVYSTYGTRCGIAAFAATLQDLLSDDFDFSFCVLDPFFFRSEVRHVMERADALLAADEANVAACDVVNLQFEPGIFGTAPSTILRRLVLILENITKHRKRLVVTNHTVYSSPRDFSLFLGLRSPGAVKRRQLLIQAMNGRLSMPRKIYRLLGDIDRMGLLTMVAHNRRDRRYLQDVWGFVNVVDHPLQHLRRGWDVACRTEAKNLRADWLRRFGKNRRIVGAFGFLADYKGFDVAIRAMRQLDESYVLLIFGGVHPNTVAEGEAVNGYLAELMDEVEGRSKRSDAAARRMRALSQAAVSANQGIGTLVGEQIEQLKSLSSRVCFMGSPDEFEFATAIAACDICVFPYREVGQSASGPMCYAIELDRQVIASATGAFRQLDIYFPGRIHYIDIGNHLQLAAAIKHAAAEQGARPPPSYNHRTMANLYRSLLAIPEKQPAAQT